MAEKGSRVFADCARRRLLSAIVDGPNLILPLLAGQLRTQAACFHSDAQAPLHWAVGRSVCARASGRQS